MKLYKMLITALSLNICNCFNIIKKQTVTSSIITQVPDIKKRELMNNILLANVGASCGTLLYGYLSFFMPYIDQNSNNGIIATDKNGENINNDKWLKQHFTGKRELVQGINGDPYYLLINVNENKLEKYALNAICTHLGCVVPWNSAENKFMCPCHGSQYDSTGKVIRGPAPRSLALATIDIVNNNVVLKKWSEEDFRDNSNPWWI